MTGTSTGRTFPPGFLWGVASAGHQNEGDNTNSDTWFVEHVTPSVFQEPSGKACDGWNRWREDVRLAANLGLTVYRFSVEWARVEPDEGSFDRPAEPFIFSSPPDPEAGGEDAGHPPS